MEIFSGYRLRIDISSRPVSPGVLTGQSGAKVNIRSSRNLGSKCFESPCWRSNSGGVENEYQLIRGQERQFGDVYLLELFSRFSRSDVGILRPWSRWRCTNPIPSDFHATYLREAFESRALASTFCVLESPPRSLPAIAGRGN